MERWERDPGDHGAIRRTLGTLIQLRLVLVTAILGLGMLALRSESAGWNRPFFVMLGITAVLSVFYWMAVRRGKNFRFQAITQLGVDLGLATGIIHYTGDFNSPFALLYILIISAGSRFLYVRGTVVLALLCAAAHGFHLSAHLLVEGSSGLAPQGTLPTFGFTGEAERLLALQVGLYTITFVFIALLSGYLSVGVRRKGAALEAAKNLLRRDRLNTDQILRSLSSGLLTVDRKGTILHFNKAAERITGLDAREVTGRSADEVLENGSPPLVTLLRGILGGWNDVLRQETTLRSRSGEVIPIGMSASPLRDEQGESAGVVCIFQDLTDVRRMEEHIRNVDRLAAVGELSAGIAHEIRNPLATISGSIQVLQSELRLEGENDRLLELVVRESDRLHRIVEEFLDFARSGPIRGRPLDVTAFLVEIRDLVLRHPKAGPGVEIVVEPPDRRFRIFADPEQLRRAFLNLAVNALDAMEGEGTLRFRVRRVAAFQNSPGEPPRTGVAICVEDTGCGIPPDRRAELFRPFFTTKKGGVGLGLALAQKVVVGHKGKIEVAGTPGEGATFTVVLPWDGAETNDNKGPEPGADATEATAVVSTGTRG